MNEIKSFLTSPAAPICQTYPQSTDIFESISRLSTFINSPECQLYETSWRDILILVWNVRDEKMNDTEIVLIAIKTN